MSFNFRFNNGNFRFNYRSNGHNDGGGFFSNLFGGNRNDEVYERRHHNSRHEEEQRQAGLAHQHESHGFGGFFRNFFQSIGGFFTNMFDGKDGNLPNNPADVYDRVNLALNVRFNDNQGVKPQKAAEIFNRLESGIGADKRLDEKELAAILEEVKFPLHLIRSQQDMAAAADAVYGYANSIFKASRAI